MRCVGPRRFRSQAARDLACLLDLDDDVVAWSCLAVRLEGPNVDHTPDLLVHKRDGAFLLDAGFQASGSWVAEAAKRHGFIYETVPEADFAGGYRLANAKDLLRYASWRCPLGDRLRLLAGLEENGSLTVAESLGAFLETKPVAGLASLVLHRFVSLDIDTEPIGPGTQVRIWNP